MAELIERLGSRDGAARTTAEAALVAAGSRAVASLLGAVAGDQLSHDGRSAAIRVLQRFGDLALAPLVDALVAAPTKKAVQGYWLALSGLQVADKAVFVALLAHPHPRVRESAVTAL